ncbi:MAG TPA: RagB/SusD family nutrient uptake outer membrane protein [Puia sp.]|nr:RagB/SusD family nutrient uptake outer membrane protein [Puia sp.]
MRTNLLKILSCLLLPVALASCKKFLDQDPVSSASDETTWSSDADANSSVAACYSLVRSALDAACSQFSYGDLPTDEFGNVADADFLKIHNMQWDVSVVSYNAYDIKLKLRVWTPFYSAIAQSNRCLHFINQMPLDVFTGNDDATRLKRKNKLLGEAYFTRALAYFYMSRIWGDVPLVTEYADDISGDLGLPRSSQANVLQSCISDLGKARQYLDIKDNTSTDRVVRADKGAVFALLAHIYAWEGSYDSCKMACDSVIGTGSYSLVSGSQYTSIYAGQSGEGIFEVAQNSSNEAMNAVASTASVAYYVLSTPYLPTRSTPNWQIGSGTLFKLYSDTANDLRYKKEFYLLNSGSTKYYCCSKYSNITTISSNGSNFYILRNNIIVFRLADILLLKAEALAAGSLHDEAGALALVNSIRLRAGLTPLPAGLTGNDLLNAITNERGAELFLEGHRFYDLIRNERLTGGARIPGMTQTEFLAGKYYWPVDPSLFTLNPNLKQTPFWTSLSN